MELLAEMFGEMPYCAAVDCYKTRLEWSNFCTEHLPTYQRVREGLNPRIHCALSKGIAVPEKKLDNSGTTDVL